MKQNSSVSSTEPIPPLIVLKNIRRWMNISSVFIGLGLLLIMAVMYLPLGEYEHLFEWLIMGCFFLIASCSGIASVYRGFLEKQEKEELQQKGKKR